MNVKGSGGAPSSRKENIDNCFSHPISSEQFITFIDVGFDNGVEELVCCFVGRVFDICSVGRDGSAVKRRGIRY